MDIKEFAKELSEATKNMSDEQRATVRQMFEKVADQLDAPCAASAVPRGEGEPYDDKYVIGMQTDWKEEGGKLFIAAEENGEPDWQELVPEDDGYVMFNMFKIAKA